MYLIHLYWFLVHFITSITHKIKRQLIYLFHRDISVKLSLNKNVFK